MVNLAGNAIKFTENGSVTIALSIVGNGEASVKIKFSVADTGIGVSRKNQQKIFKAFTQEDEDTNSHMVVQGSDYQSLNNLLN